MSDLRPPRSLTDLVGWFRAQWEAEIPPDIHSRGVWHDKEASSALGAPALAPGFSAYLMGSPFATDHDPRLDQWTAGAVRVRPMHAVLAEMARPGPLSDGAYRAAWLLRLACLGWDIEATANATEGFPPQAARDYTRTALERAWSMWERNRQREAREVAA